MGTEPETGSGLNITEQWQHEYIPNTEADIREMLTAIGVRSLEELFTDIPEEVRKGYQPLGLEPLSEAEVVKELQRLANRNINPNEYISFLGGGIYEHFMPSVVEHIISRSEFYTSYTPYQPEVSQGTLTWMFEFQTFICELTGMEVANATMYDGATALAEALFMAARVSKKKKFIVAKSLNPHYLQVLRTYAWAAELELIELNYTDSGQLDRVLLEELLSDEIGGLAVQTPNFFGVVEDLSGLKEQLGEALLLVSVNPIALGVLNPPGAFGADIVTGEGQVLGNRPNFGGPLLGLFASRERYLRQMPGRIIGQTVDVEGRVGYVMTLQAREQHIRRARATSNICSNEALCGLAATVFLATLGKQGLRELAELNLQKAHYLAEQVKKLSGYRLRFSGPFFNEFVVETEREPREILLYLHDAGILGGIDLTPYGLKNSLLITVTEQRSKAELDLLAQKLEEV